jgi:hypothetical protein
MSMLLCFWIAMTDRDHVAGGTDILTRENAKLYTVKHVTTLVLLQ